MHVARATILTACLAAGACDIPTEAPIIDQRWVIPLEAVSLDQAELLPASVSILGNQYAVAVPDGVATETVGNLCGPCNAVNGLTGPAPAFTGSFSSVEALPNAVVSADVASGSVALSINNQLGWDPIAGGGSITITLRGASGGPVLGTLQLQSPADALPNGVTTMANFAMGAGEVTGGIESVIDVVSPGGEITTMDTSNTITVTAVTSMMRAFGATVDVDGLTASLSEEELDTEDIDESIVDNIISGTVVLDVMNPFGLVYSGDVVVGTITKSMVIPADATSQVEISYTGDELRSFIGVPGVTLSGTGIISGGPAMVAPTDSLIIDPSLDVVVELGGS